jgi:predicted oxidoreductase
MFYTLLIKDPKLLRSYTTGPFYAIKAVHKVLSTNGGIQCDNNMNVIDTNLNPIPGLYVAGVMVGSQVGETYPMGIQGGTSTGFGMAAARIIIRNAAAELKGGK